jgi:hypothetical protein
MMRMIRDGMGPPATYATMNLPRFGRHLRSHESAVGVCHGETEAAIVHDGVQGAGGAGRS